MVTLPGVRVVLLGDSTASVPSSNFRFFTSVFFSGVINSAILLGEQFSPVASGKGSFFFRGVEPVAIGRKNLVMLLWPDISGSETDVT